VIPSLRGWYEEYSAEGLVVIGNHYPEFKYEADLDNLRQAVIDLDIPYAVAQDNDGQTWRAYNNRYWPTLYLIDKKGHLRYAHIGEGRYDETEAVIQALLDEPFE
jgi:AhpC/TSA family